MKAFNLFVSSIEKTALGLRVPRPSKKIKLCATCHVYISEQCLIMFLQTLFIYLLNLLTCREPDRLPRRRVLFNHTSVRLMLFSELLQFIT